jgi:hypothetical protein
MLTTSPGNPAGAGPDPAQVLFPEARHRRLRRWLAASAALVTVAAVAVTAMVWRPWAGGPPSSATGAAGGAALAGQSRGPVGQASFTWRTTVSSQPQAEGTEHVTFSGQNRIISFSTKIFRTGPYRGDHRAGTAHVVAGQHYDPRTVHSRRVWVRTPNVGFNEPTIVDPRALLGLLRARTPLRSAGTQVIGGLKLRVLTAADPFWLTRRNLLPVLGTNGGPVFSLRVWVDSQGVVHRMTYSFRNYPATILPTQVVSQAALRRYRQATRAVDQAFRRAARYEKRTGKPAPERWVKLALLRQNLWLQMAYRERTGAELTEITVSYTGVGQPQPITAPPHSIDGQQYKALRRGH